MDDDVHVIVLRGAGEKFFCAGANISMLKDADAEFKYYFCLHANETLNRLEQTPKLVIAALERPHASAAASRSRWRPTSASPRKDAGKIGLPEVDARRAAGHRRHAAAGAPRRQGARDRADGRPAACSTSRRRKRSASSTTSGTATATTLRGGRARIRASSSARRTRPARPSAASSARCSRAPRLRSAKALAHRARAAAAALPERGREGRHRRQPREAKPEVHGTINACLRQARRHEARRRDARASVRARRVFVRRELSSRT